MGPTLMAAFLLWLPALLAVFGTFNLLGRGGPIWKVLTPLCVVLALLAPMTVPDSTSTQAVELLWGVIVIGAPLLVGLALMVFSGDVPVGRAPTWGRPVGLVLVGIASFLLVTWEPAFVTDEGLWGRFVLVFLAASISLCGGLYVTHRLFVPRRRSRSWPMLAGSLLAGALLVLHGAGGQTGPSAVAEIAGLFLGAGLALLLSVLVIWLFERNLPEPQALPPPSQDDLERAAAIVARRMQTGGELDG